MELNDLVDLVARHGVLVASGFMLLAALASTVLVVAFMRGRRDTDTMSDGWSGRRRPYIPEEMP